MKTWCNAQNVNLVLLWVDLMQTYYRVNCHRSLCMLSCTLLHYHMQWRCMLRCSVGTSRNLHFAILFLPVLWYKFVCLEEDSYVSDRMPLSALIGGDRSRYKLMTFVHQSVLHCGGAPGSSSLWFYMLVKEICCSTYADDFSTCGKYPKTQSQM